MENRLGIKNTPLCRLPRSGGVFGSAQGIMGMASTLPSVLCTKSLMFPWSIVRYPLIARMCVFYQTLETPYSRNEATMRECQRELSQILKSISPLTVEKKVCVKVPHLIDQSKYWKAFYFNLRFFLTNDAMRCDARVSLPKCRSNWQRKWNGLDDRICCPLIRYIELLLFFL